jgi:hypothetical protein
MGKVKDIYEQTKYLIFSFAHFSYFYNNNKTFTYMKKNIIRLFAIFGIIIAMNACVGKSSYECYFPPQTMRFCIIDSTLNSPASWINNSNKDSLHLYSVKNGTLTPISFYLDSINFDVPIVMSYEMANLASASDSTQRITEFRLYGSKKMQSEYHTIIMSIIKSGDENCIYYLYESPLLDGRAMKLGNTTTYWTGSLIN